LIQRARRSIRARLTAWYIVVLATVMLAYAVTASYLLFRELRVQLLSFAVRDLQTIEGLFYFDEYQTLRLRDDYLRDPNTELEQSRILEVRSESGEIIYRSSGAPNRDLDRNLTAEEGITDYSGRDAVLTDGTRALVVSRRHSVEGTIILLRLAYSMEPLYKQFRAELFALLIPLPFVLAAAGLVGYYLARQALKPIRDMSRQAAEITSERLHARLPVDEAAGELADLARIFNEMLSRLERSFEQLKRFTSDASHELRTPLTLLRSVGEVGLQTGTKPEDYQDTIGSMLEEANRLTELVENLLTISRADAGQLALAPTSFRAIELVRESSNLLDVLLEEKGQTLRISGDESLEVMADWLLLRQALVNILHNAIKHSPPQGAIGIDLSQPDSGWLAIAIRDSGPGIPPEDQPKVFDRFYRVDTSRSQSGVGLGLSIAQWAVRAHGGDISVRSASPLGTIFEIRLPACHSTEMVTPV
jgi:heavy metal sensor kinase